MRPWQGTVENFCPDQLVRRISRTLQICIQPFKPFAEVTASDPKSTDRSNQSKTIVQRIVSAQPPIECRADVGMFLLDAGCPSNLISAVDVYFGFFGKTGEMRQIAISNFGLSSRLL
jgi:hypothetical protein